jgi:hypothetical protein
MKEREIPRFGVIRLGPLSAQRIAIDAEAIS